VKCLVVQTAYLGDAMLTLPLLDLLRASGKVDWLGALVSPLGAGLLRHQGKADEVVEWDKRRDGGLAGTLRTAAALRDVRADAALVAHRSFRSALLPLLAGVPRRAGFDESGGRLLLSSVVPYRARPHEVERVAGLAAAVGVTVPAGRVPYSLRVGDEDRERAERFLTENGVAPGRPVVLAAPGSRWATKRWPPDRFARAAERVADETGAAVVVSGAVADAEACRAAAGAMRRPPVDAVGRPDLGEWLALTARASVVISNDSAAAHAAAGVGTPVVAVFGPTVPELGFAPYSEAAAVVGVELDCRPCGRHGHDACPLGHHACMERATVDAVVSAALALLERRSSP
jgi:heptosyltransferase-2